MARHPSVPTHGKELCGPDIALEDLTISDDDIAISVENLGKSYLVGHNAKREGYTALRDVLGRGVKDFVRKTRDMLSGRPIVQGDEVEEFWALKDVSFEIKRGERLGVIGRNGAGKSTLLKLLSRITEPTEGRIRINGRVASLLEVGTGFHPELTGRENIFLNGAILGMSRKEISRKFDEIVEFAEVEQFLDTPVKRYSSGMYVRLAFAVAAHLEPEILIIDEVLAVGDAQFQKKCLGKMEQVGRDGRTILFVSHNMEAIRQLCDRAILLQDGKATVDADPDTGIRRYLEGTGSMRGGSMRSRIQALPTDPVFRLIDATLTQDGVGVSEHVVCEKPLKVFMEYEIKEETPGLRVFLDICDDLDTLLMRSFFDEASPSGHPLEKGTHASEVELPVIFGPTKYRIYVNADIFNTRYVLPSNSIYFDVSPRKTLAVNPIYLSEPFRAKLAAGFSWKTTKV